LGSVCLEITKALGAICGLHAIHSHPKECAAVSSAKGLNKMVKPGLIDLWNGETYSDGPALTGL